MKCIKATKQNVESGGNPNEVIRTTDVKAAKAVKSGQYEYCSKQLWKDSGRHYSPARSQNTVK